MDNQTEWSSLEVGVTGWTTMALALTIIGLAIIERWWHMGKLERLGYTGPPKSFFSGNINSISEINADLQDGWRKLIDAYGSQVGNLEGKSIAIYQGRIPTVVVTNPEVIKYIAIRNFDNFRNRPFSKLQRNKNLLSLRDDRWRSVRHTLTPTFSQAKMKLMSGTINDIVSTTLDVIEDHVKKNKPVDFYKLYHGLTLEVISKCALAINVDSQRNPDHPLLYTCKQIFKSFRVDSPTRVFSVMFPSLTAMMRKMLGIKLVTSRKDFNSLSESVRKVIEERRTTKQVGKTVDALQLMIEAAQLDTVVEDSSSSPLRNGSALNGLNGLNGKPTGKDLPNKKQESKMTEEEVADNAIVFLLAGYETTSTMLSFTSYLLAKHQGVQRRLQEEIDQHLEDKDDVTYDTINQMQYLEMVMNESLRFYPPIASNLSREVEEDCEYEGMKFPANTLVSIPIAYIHYDEKLWPNAKQFDPERFHPDGKKDIHVSSFLPFGVGPRHCIGMRFAMMEAKLAMVRLLQRYHLQPCHLTEDTIQMNPSSISLSPKSGHIYLSCVPR